MTDKPTELLTVQDLADPSITQNQLAAIAQARPDLHREILRHPRIYSGLREWIYAVNPDVKLDDPKTPASSAAVEQPPTQWQQPQSQQSPPEPSQLRPQPGVTPREVSHSDHTRQQWQESQREQQPESLNPLRNLYPRKSLGLWTGEPG